MQLLPYYTKGKNNGVVLRFRITGNLWNTFLTTINSHAIYSDYSGIILENIDEYYLKSYFN